jgi:hypothetical protein
VKILLDFFADPGIIINVMKGLKMQIRTFDITGVSLVIDELEAAAQFYGELLMGKTLIKNLKIRLVFSKTQGNGATWEDDIARPREFTITLEKGMSKRETFITLAHEMVHVKQYATGELRDYMSSSKLQRWRNEKRDWSQVEYWDLPWEIEAYGRERGLYVRYVDHVVDKEFLDSLKKSA